MMQHVGSVCVCVTHTYTRALRETACGNARFTLMTSSSKMGSRGIFHRLSSVAVERPLPIPSPPALMYTTRVGHDAASAGPGGLLLDHAPFQCVKAPGVGRLRAFVASRASRIASGPYESSEAVYVNRAVPSRLGLGSRVYSGCSTCQYV